MSIKTTPILYQGDMIRALLDGRKTQTRRIMTPDQVEAIEFMAGGPEGEPADVDRLGLRWDEPTEDLPNGKIKTHPAQWLVYSSEYPEEGVIPIGKGYGQPGDLLWVRETWQLHHTDRLGEFGTGPEVIDAEYGGPIPKSQPLDSAVIYKATDDEPGATYRPSIHMPRWASRLTLRITDVRVERVQDISEADALAEGLETWPHEDDVAYGFSGGAACGYATPTGAFHALWDYINAANGYGWDANPWVWVIEFEVIHDNVDRVIERLAA